MKRAMTESRVTYARIAGLRRQLAARPGDAAALCALGTALWWSGQRDEGMALLQQAVEADRGCLEAATNLGNVLVALGQVEAAAAHYRTVLAARPDDATAHFNLGCAWLTAGRLDDAVAGFRAALALRPDYAAALNNLGSVLRQQGRPAEALDHYRRAAAVRPDLPGVQGNIGSVLLALGRADEALTSLRTAARLAPDDAEACNNLGGVLLALDQAPEAAGWFRLAVRSDPGLHQARFGLALALLTQGAFREGWEAYDARWLDPAFTGDEHRFEQPAWRGEEPVAGRRILLHAEQGLGDTLQFVRYAPLLRARGARVVLQVQAPLMGLLAGLADAVVERDSAPPAFDLRCPLLSLPRAFATELHSIPADIPYLSAPPAHLSLWSARLGERTRPRIGIAVAGAASHPEDAQRSIPADVFLTAFAGIDAELHVLQKQIRDADAPALAPLNVHDALIEDFCDTAALVALMDLVVTVDTAPAHLAGALGVPVWVLLQYGADFRWLSGRTDSPWYPTARLFRQPRYGDWAAVLAQVNAALRAA
jgi:tetratricopeptide (TPR) repeat protein